MLSFRGEVLAPDGSDFAETEFEQVLGADPHAHAAELGHQAGAALKPRAAAWLAV